VESFRDESRLANPGGTAVKPGQYRTEGGNIKGGWKVAHSLQGKDLLRFRCAGRGRSLDEYGEQALTVMDLSQ